MRTEKILPQSVYVDNVIETQKLYDFYVPKFLKNFRKSPHLSKDWHIHTDYHIHKDSSNRKVIDEIDFDLAKEVYSRYINKFISFYFEEFSDSNWSFKGIWYNVYGENQEAKVHDHSGHSFSLVHYLQYEEGCHSPIIFIEEYTEEECSLKIENGDIIMFNSSTLHKVGPNNSSKPRISIAMNINIQGLGPIASTNFTKEELEVQKYCDALNGNIDNE